jgi:homoserine kinase
MIRESLQDVVIEPQRQALIPGFQDVRKAAIDAGALGCSISGAGPTMFAWAIESRATAVLEAMRTEFARHSIQIDDWIVEVDSAGARVIED